MLTLTGVGKRYPTGDRALTDIQLSLPKGQVMALIGPSGAGKSTLIRCVNRLVEPTQGSIRLEDVELTKLSGSRLRHARRSMGMIFQEYALVDRLSVMENVLSGREGTARRAGKGLEYRMGGKSGTAQVFSLGQDEKYNADELAERLRDHALFIAFAPVDDPQIAISVIVENAGGGSSHASYLARDMADAWILGRDDKETDDDSGGDGA